MTQTEIPWVSLFDRHRLSVERGAIPSSAATLKACGVTHVIAPLFAREEHAGDFGETLAFSGLTWSWFPCQSFHPPEFDPQDIWLHLRDFADRYWKEPLPLHICVQCLPDPPRAALVAYGLLSITGIEVSPRAKFDLLCPDAGPALLKHIDFVDDVLTHPATPCECCGYRTLPHEVSYEVCAVCHWIDNGHGSNGSGDNKLILREAKKNFAAFGACEKPAIPRVRNPWPSEH